MQAMRFHDYGGPEVLRHEEVEAPTPGAGEVLIRVAGSAFNPVDDGIRGGWLREPFPVVLPHVPGVDVSGTVEALGEGVTGVVAGDAVVAFLPMVADGSAAELVVAPADVLAPAPERVELADAAALPLAALTAHQALFEDGGLRSGQRVLVNGAGGAVGGYAVQLATRAGAVVVAVASSRSRGRATDAGAAHVIDPHAGRVTLDEPVDLLVNLAPVAAEQLAGLASQVRPGGVVVNTVPSVATPADEARGVRGVSLFVRGDARRLAELSALVDRGELRVDVAERLPLADLADVHARAAAGTLSGKVVLVP